MNFGQNLLTLEFYPAQSLVRWQRGVDCTLI